MRGADEAAGQLSVWAEDASSCCLGQTAGFAEKFIRQRGSIVNAIR